MPGPHPDLTQTLPQAIQVPYLDLAPALHRGCIVRQMARCGIGAPEGPKDNSNPIESHIWIEVLRNSISNQLILDVS